MTDAPDLSWLMPRLSLSAYSSDLISILSYMHNHMEDSPANRVHRTAVERELTRVIYELTRSLPTA